MEKMSRHPIPLNPSFLPPATHGVLKSLLENPMKLPLHHEGSFTNCVFITRSVPVSVWLHAHCVLCAGCVSLSY